MKKPDLLYRKSKDGLYIYLRVPDQDTEEDSVLMFNRIMADYGFPDPKSNFNERLGVAVFPSRIKLRQGNRLVTYDLFKVLIQYFSMRPIKDEDWHGRRF